MDPRTCYRKRKSRWRIEDMHRDEKQFCGLGNTCFWKEDPLTAHFKFVFFLWWLFERFKMENKLKVSTEELWWEYKRQVDWSKAERLMAGKPPPLSAFFNYV
jgi:hypothetical protein